MSNLQIVSLNCRGLGDFHKRKQILNSSNVDVCFLQETQNIYQPHYYYIHKDLGGKCVWSFGTSRSKGVGIWFKEKLNYEILLFNRDICMGDC